MIFLLGGVTRHAGRSANGVSSAAAMFDDVVSSSNLFVSAGSYNLAITPIIVLPAYGPDNRYYALSIRCLSV